MLFAQSCLYFLTSEYLNWNKYVIDFWSEFFNLLFKSPKEISS